MKTLNLCLGLVFLIGQHCAVAAIADRFDYPIGNRDRYTEANDGDGWYVALEFGEWNPDVSKYHIGEDWNAESLGNTDCGLPLYAVANGTIVYANIASGWGRVLIVRHTLPDGSQVESLYGHLASFAKTSGDVARGEQVGTIGDGREGGVTYLCHLHLEVRTAACPNWGQPGPGYSATSTPVGWTDPSEFLDAHAGVCHADSEVIGWWNDDYSQTTIPSGLSNAVAIAAGGRYSLALTAEGRVVGWGLLDIDGHRMTIPGTLSNVVAIAAGYDHSLALRVDGRVVGWGENWGGQTTIPNGLSRVVAIAAGRGHSLALTAEGRVVGWGANNYGQRTIPSGLTNAVAIAAGALHSLAVTTEGRVVGWGIMDFIPSGLSNVVAIAAGEYHSLALTADGRVFGWGYDDSGQTTIPSGLSNVVAIAAGSYHSLAVTTEGRVVGWGRNGDGQTASPSGLSNVVTIAAGCSSYHSLALTAEGRVVGWGLSGEGQTTSPSGLSNAVAIAAGQFHSLALTAEGRVVGYGYNNDGQTTSPSNLSNVVAIAAGRQHSMALTAEGQVVGWGDNRFGQTTIPSNLSNVVAIAAADLHGLALTADGRVVGWGDNYSGQTTSPSGLSNVVAIAAGALHSLALTAEGRVVGWGGNYSGQTNIPTGLSNVVAIAAGASHSLALTAEGRVVGWGKNSYGQRNIPSGLSNVVAIAAGGDHSLALTAEGRVVRWGYNGSGQTTITSGLSNVVAIAAGESHSLALTGDGTPAITLQPVTQSVIAGETATFQVAAVWAAGTPPLGYQWRKNGLPLADGGNVSGARSNALTLANAQWADVGQYTVVITNAFGSVTSQVANLTVLGVTPQFLTQPQSQMVLLGTNVIFRVTVTGTPPLSFQWRFNGVNLSEGGRVSGTRTSTLTITNVQSQDPGLYTAVVSNPWGSVTSAPAMFRLFSRLTLLVSNQTPARFDFTNAAWVEVTLTAPFLNPFIWYTLDGSPPSPSSTEYTGTFIVSNTVVVRALAINPADFSSVEMAPAAINLWTAFHLIATATAGGMVSLAPPGGFYVSNMVVTLTAVPEPAWEFLNWTGDASGTATNLNVVMNRDKIVTAQFGLIPRYTLTATTVGSGTVAGNTQSDYLRGTTVCLTAAPAVGWEFLSWTGDASGTSSNVCVVMDRNKSVTARFGLIPRFTLTATTAGSGTVAGNTQSNYLRGTTVNLSAEPAPSWEFLSWSGDASGTSSNISVVMDTNKSVTAQFRQLLFTLTVTTVGGGAVSGNTQSNYSRGTAVNLSAEPAPGWYFQSWTGDAGGTSRNASVVVDRDKSVAARFAPLTLLAVTAGGGTIAANPASNYVQDSTVELTAQPQSGWTFLNWMGDASGTNPQASVTMDRPKEVQAVFGTECKTTVLGQGVVVRNLGTGLVPFGAVVRLTAIPQPGYYFALWGNAASSLVNPLDFTVTNANPVVGAFFSALGANQVTLTVQEQGAGIVAREPQVNFYTKGQAVRLTAQPFPGQAFLGWSGDALSLIHI